MDLIEVLTSIVKLLGTLIALRNSINRMQLPVMRFLREFLLTVLTIIFHSGYDRSISRLIIKSLETGMDEEWRGFIGEQKHELSESGLTKSQINRKTMISLFAFHCGRFKSWTQLLKFLSWVKLIYK
jgi:hypothetical protein